MTRADSCNGRLPDTTRLIVVFLALPVVLSVGCAFQRTSKEVEAAHEMGVISGSVALEAGTAGSYVLLFPVAEDGAAASPPDVAQLSELQDHWAFVVNQGTPFVIGAFKDTDGNGVRDATEPAGYLGANRPLELAAGVRIGGYEIDLSTETPDIEGFPLDITGDLPKVQSAIHFSVGEVVTLDDDRFTPERASDGMWTPLTGIRDTGAGIYFLEPFDESRIPVLFVHGIGGTPRDLQTIIERIDRSRFQPWLYHYPSGFRLATISRGLVRTLPRLQEQLGFESVVVIAHSMGGLVARSAVLDLSEAPETEDLVGLFITLASPLGGHPAVKWGLKFLDNPVPAWVDIEPGSPFIERISRPLPEGVPYNLLFGFRRESSIFLQSSSDSVVPVDSQLPMWAQRDADRMWGFDTDHMDILAEPEPVSTVLAILDRHAAQAVRGEK
jgi:pimeloyl-ACP methyl ester carboxylesterase